MRRALVTGSSGFVGRALVVELLRRGYKVRGAVRRPRVHVDGEEVIEVGELSGLTEWSAALNDVDTVFHAAARVHQIGDASDREAAYQQTNVEGTAALGRAALVAGVRRFVFLSSAKVMGEVSAQRPFVERDEPRPQDAYARSKLAAELELERLAKEIAVTIVRPPLVYGPGVRANFLRLLRLAATPLPLPLAAAQAPRSLIFVENLVDALIASATVAHSSPATYFVSDGEDVTVADLIGMLRADLGTARRLWPLPTGILKAGARLLGRASAANRLLAPLQLDTQRIRRELRWVPPVPSRDGLKATVRWFVDARSRGELMK